MLKFWKKFTASINFHLFINVQSPEKLPGNPEIFDAASTSGSVTLTSGKVLVDCDVCSGLSFEMRCRLKLPASFEHDSVALYWTSNGKTVLILMVFQQVYHSLHILLYKVPYFSMYTAPHSITPLPFGWLYYPCTTLPVSQYRLFGQNGALYTLKYRANKYIPFSY